MSPRNRAIPALLIALAALAVLAAPAAAARRATRAEEGDLIHAFRIAEHAPAHEVGVELAGARISTVSKHWAAARVSLYIDPGMSFAGGS